MSCKTCLLTMDYGLTSMQSGRLYNEAMPDCEISKTKGRKLQDSDIGKLVVRIYPSDKYLHREEGCEGCMQYEWSHIPLKPTKEDATSKAVKVASLTSEIVRLVGFGDINSTNDSHWMLLEDYIKLFVRSEKLSAAASTSGDKEEKKT